MKFISILILSIFATTPVIASDFEIDGDHAFAIFKAIHIDMGETYGRFDRTEGSFKYDETSRTLTSVDVSIRTSSLSTGVSQRDTHLKGPDFLNASQFKTISFKSTSITKTDEDAYQVTGDLTLHGVTRPSSITMERVGEGIDPWNNYRVGAKGTFSINRQDFGMSKLLDIVGPTIDLIISFEGTKQ